MADFSWCNLFGVTNVLYIISYIAHLSRRKRLHQLKSATKGMRKCEALFMVTIFRGSNILSNSLSALVVLQEMDSEAWWKVEGYFTCIAGMMFGISILVEGENPCPKEDEEMVLISAMEEGLECERSERMSFANSSAKDKETILLNWKDVILNSLAIESQTRWTVFEDISTDVCLV